MNFLVEVISDFKRFFFLIPWELRTLSSQGIFYFGSCVDISICKVSLPAPVVLFSSKIMYRERHFTSAHLLVSTVAERWHSLHGSSGAIRASRWLWGWSCKAEELCLCCFKNLLSVQDFCGDPTSMTFHIPFSTTLYFAKYCTNGWW